MVPYHTLKQRSHVSKKKYIILSKVFFSYVQKFFSINDCYYKKNNDNRLFSFMLAFEVMLG